MGDIILNRTQQWFSWQDMTFKTFLQCFFLNNWEKDKKESYLFIHKWFISLQQWALITDLILIYCDALQWNWSSPGMKSGSWRKPPMYFWLRASMSWLMARITTSPCCCTLARPLSSWNSWLRIPSSAFSTKSPSRESRRSPTPCKSPRGTVRLPCCTALRDPVSQGSQF